MADAAQEQDFLRETKRYITLCREMNWADYVLIAQEQVSGRTGGKQTLEALEKTVSGCKRCVLSQTRTNIVFGEGSTAPKVVFVGEAPGHDEDMQGKPFVGRAGQLLTKIIRAMGFERKEVYIGNILKCRPPNNRNPLPDEIECCEPYLIQQLALLQPRVIVALGTFAAQTLLKTDLSIGKLRGRFHSYQDIPLMPTYHPAFLLRSPGRKRDVWEDIKQVIALLNKSGRPEPGMT